VYDPQVIRSSVGTFFACPVLCVESHRDVEAWAARAAQEGLPYRIIGTSAKAERPLNEYHFENDALIVLMGNETRGLSRAYKEMAEALVAIPISGAASSLNVSGALAIVLYEICRQRGEARQDH
jgi:TrmH family RNA methyltransferase